MVRQKAVVLFLLLSCLLSTIALADKLEGGGYTLYNTINSGGATLQGGGYTLTDTKGEIIGGKMTGGGYEFIPWIFGMSSSVQATSTEETPPLGTVPLTISRDGANIKIKWDLKYGNDTVIYYSTGNGEGQFNNSDLTKWVVAAGVDFIDDSMMNQCIFHKDQVGAGAKDKEVYYKGFLKTAVPGSTSTDSRFSGKTILETAWAVGKVNVSLKGTANVQGKNLVSVPFKCQQGSKVKDVFGEGSGSVWKEGDIVQYKFAASPAYYSAIYTSANVWKDAANANDDPKFEIDYKFGNWVITKDDKTITVVGEVVNKDTVVPVFSGAGETTGGKTLLGMVYPVRLGLTSTSLINNGAADGDLIQYKISPLNEAYISAIVMGGAWKSASNPSNPLEKEIDVLAIPNSYIFVRYKNSGFDWNRAKP
ncbi:MAG: hypothetical protein FD145_930 [Candidatus Saganbacteria bacterium]|uniref:Uncharacterized protein n=1 Tax=Candidatus Saganbacteria bacterium TaxID=2575572 RepID=A0A833L124_UNCSA|nr:MAG: hypothetical protein FD145_930 [Candidatus Saganbacteria bacterium]